MMMRMLHGIRAVYMEPDLAVQNAAERLDHANAEHE